jgi:hypothetical protein
LDRLRFVGECSDPTWRALCVLSGFARWLAVHRGIPVGELVDLLQREVEAERARRVRH